MFQSCPLDLLDYTISFLEYMVEFVNLNSSFKKFIIILKESCIKNI